MSQDDRHQQEQPPILDLVAELGVQRLSVVVAEPGKQPFRPRMCLWVDSASGMILHFKLQDRADDPLRVIIQSMLEMSDRTHGLPRQIQMRDPKLAAELKELLMRFGIEVVVRESLPMLDLATESLGTFQGAGLGVKKEPSLIELPGMTLDRMIGYAEAAKEFYEARPWHYLIDDDLIEIAEPAGPKGTRYAQVLGAGGREFGLGFVATRDAHEKMRAGEGLPRGGVWSLLFGELDFLRFDDGEAWERHNLPAAGPGAYPNFLKMMSSRPMGALPTADELTWAEGLLRALATTTEDELDSGRWEKTVQTANGARTYKLSLPILLEQMAGAGKPDPHAAISSGRTMMEQTMRAITQQLQKRGAMGDQAALDQIVREMNAGGKMQFQPSTPAEKAQGLAYQARDARGRRQIQLARQALAIDPDCSDAIMIMAERIIDPERALPLLRQAMQAGERQLGRDFFQKNAGHFWGVLESRPYMRARNAVATALMNLEQYPEAIDHLQEMLRLNPGDNQGNRYLLAQSLLMANRLDDLEELLNRGEYKTEFSAEWAYTRALLEFRRGGDSPQARLRLSEARRVNPYFAPLITGAAEMPLHPPMSYSPGSVDEAAGCVFQLGAAWEETDGAIEWLQSVTAPQDKRAKQWQRERESKRKRNRR